jgi:hypothetical protein
LRISLEATAEGFRFALDPETYRNWQPANMWESVEKILCSMLILRTEHNFVMSRSEAEEMTRRAPNARLKEIAEG